jgi:hypothetical protein
MGYGVVNLVCGDDREGFFYLGHRFEGTEEGETVLLYLGFGVEGRQTRDRGEESFGYGQAGCLGAFDQVQFGLA